MTAMNLAIRSGPTASALTLRTYLLPSVLVAGAAAAALAAGVGGATWLAPAFAFAAAFGVIVAMATRSGRQAFRQIGGLPLPAAAFAIALLALVSASTPWAPGGGNPLWSAVDGAPGAAMLDLEAGLTGLLCLAGLGLHFVLAAAAGVQRERAAAAMHAVPVALAAAVVLLAVRIVLFGAWAEVGLMAALAGLILIVSIGGVARRWRVERPRGLIGRLKVARVELSLAALGLVALGARIEALAMGVVAGLFLIGWEILASGGEGRLRRGPLLALLALGASVGLSLAALALRALGGVADQALALCQGAHLKAIAASPLLGYGPGSTEAVARLSMNRLNIAALLDPACPHSAYFSAAEQGGALVIAPMVAALGLVVAALVIGSTRRRRMATAIRSVVCALGFLCLFGAVDVAPVSLAASAPMVLLLGLAFGAAGAEA